MANTGMKKKGCEKYRQSGRREENKRLKQQRAEKRLAKFAARREAGKTYQYRPNPYPEGTREYEREARERAAKNVSKKTEYARWTSIMRKLQNQIDEEMRLVKLAELGKSKGAK